MDINLIRSLVTVGAFLGFLGIVVWVYLPARKAQLNAAAHVPLESTHDHPGTSS